MPVFTIKEDHHFGECLPFTIYREDVPFAAVVGEGAPAEPATAGDRARADQFRDALAASEPTTGPHHGADVAEQVRLATALVGTDDKRGRQELRDIISYLGRLAAAGMELEGIRAAVKAHDDKLNDENQRGGAQPPTGDDYNDIHALVMAGAPDFEMRTEHSFRVFAPISSAARQWCIDAMPDGAVSEDGDRYTVHGSEAADMASVLAAEGFRVREVL